MTAAGELVKFTRDGNVAKVEMSRAPHNLMEGAMMRELSAAFTRAVKEGCRSILVASALRHFSAGADLATAESGEMQDLDLLGFVHEMERLPIPTVAAVHGFALGGGFELALACDLIIAADTAELGLVEASLGLFPLMGGISRVVARCGLGRAKEIILLSRRYSASTLEQWGVINQVVPADLLSEASMALAQQLAAGPTIAYQAVRKIANETAMHGLLAGDELAVKLAADAWRTNDVRAGLEAFRKTGAATAVFEGS